MRQEGKAVWFRRGDGAEFEVNEGSAAFEAMANNSAFTRIPGPGLTEEPEPAAEPVSEEKPKGKGSKKAEVAE